MGSVFEDGHSSNGLADIDATLGSFCMVITLKRLDFHQTRSAQLRLAHERPREPPSVRACETVCGLPRR